MDFESLGLWNFDGTAWRKISDFNAEALTDYFGLKIFLWNTE